MDILQTMTGRQSIHACVDTAVDKKIVHGNPDAARWTCSTINTQPALSEDPHGA